MNLQLDDVCRMITSRSSMAGCVWGLSVCDDAMDLGMAMERRHNPMTAGWPKHTPWSIPTIRERIINMEYTLCILTDVVSTFELQDRHNRLRMIVTIALSTYIRRCREPLIGTINLVRSAKNLASHKVVINTTTKGRN